MAGAPFGTHAFLAVMPFKNLSAEEPQDYFSRGFTEDLITDLSRFNDLNVLASHSTTSVRALELHPHFRLHGSLRRSGERMRVSAQLIETESGSVVWGERFDKAAEDIFAIQDEICAQVVATVSARIQAKLTAAAKRKPTTELVAYDYWLRGFDYLKQGTVEADERARESFEKALSCDPNYSRAYLGLSLSYFNEWSCQLWERWDENERRAYEYASRALALDPDDHYATLVLGRVFLFRREFDRAEQFLERSIQLNPNDADCLVQAAMGFGFLDRADHGVQLFQRALELNPFHEPWYYAYGGVLAFAQERYGDLLQCASKNAPDIMVDIPAYLAVAHLHLGQTQAAHEQVQVFLEQFQRKIAAGRAPGPGEALRWLQHTNPYRNPSLVLRLIEGVRRAGFSGSQLPAPIATAPAFCSFRRVGSLWQVSFAGHDAWLPQLKGFSDIHALLATPGRYVHCCELMGEVGSSFDEPQIDARARAEYQERIDELRSSLEEAEAASDLGRSARLREELAQLVEHLTSAMGLGGRSRKLGAPVERARSAVTQRIRGALKKLGEAHPSLAEHLTQTVQTGTFCCYRPVTPPIEWEL